MSKEPSLNDHKERIEELIDRHRVDDLKTALRDMHPADIAEILSDLSEEDLNAVFKHIDSKKAGTVLDEMGPEAQKDVIESIDETELAHIINGLPSDEQADIVATVEEEKRDRILGKLDAESSRDIGELLQYSADTAGGLMTTEIITLSPEVEVKEAIGIWRREGDPGMSHFLYIVNESHRLLGYVGARALLMAGDERKLGSIMTTDVKVVDVNTDQQEVAQMFRKYDLIVLPVVDEQNALKGAITVDDVLEVIRDENSEDFYRMAGTGEKDPFHETILKKSLRRLPWLSITLIGGMLTVKVMQSFDTLLNQIIVLTFFIPVIIATAGNVAIQSATVIVRGLALGEAKKSRLLSNTMREVGVGVVVGLFCSVISGVGAGLFINSAELGFVIGISMMCAITLASFNGVLIPLFCDFAGIDPAIVSGPFITTLNDVLGVLIYLGIGTLILL